MELTTVTSVGLPLANGSYRRNFCRPTIVDESYWAVTSIGYGRPTEDTQKKF
jgi:hypothetical protein